MKWYIPSWNGDIRLVDKKKRAVLVVIDPTASEVERLADFHKVCVENKWWEGDGFVVPAGKTEHGFELDEKTSVVAPALVRALRGTNPAVLTAVKFDDGGIATAAGTSIDLDAIAKKIAAEEEASEKPDGHASRAFREPKGAEKQPAPLAKVAVSVKRPTPSCPQCVPGSIEPAREVLLSFLSESQHAMWAKHRQIVVRGGTSGVQYLISHRHSARAQRQGRICFDLDHESVIHFHDTSVPPEEEVLAAKLILEHRESWLRNEATALGMCNLRDVYKNPFGDGLDGTRDAAFTMGFGGSFMQMVKAQAES